MAMLNPCDLDSIIVNTGSECDDAMLATRQLYMMLPTFSWTDEDEADFTGFLQTAIQAHNVFPIFGDAAPIRSIVDANEADVIEQMEDGSKSFVRRGMMGRTFSTDKGGLCLVQHLFQLNKTMSFIEVDEDQKVIRQRNADDSLSGFPSNLAYSPTPDLATFKTVFKPKFMLDFSPNNYIKKGEIVKGDATEDILSLTGLIDAEVTTGTGAHSTTHIFVGVKTLCADTDLVAKYLGTGAGKIGQIANFVVTAANGTVITPSAVAITNGEVNLTGVFTTATNITVALAAASVLQANGIEGYDGVKGAIVPIP